MIERMKKIYRNPVTRGVVFGVAAVLLTILHVFILGLVWKP